MIREKRSYLRLPTGVRVTYRRLDDVRMESSVTKDISGGGIRIPVVDDLEVGCPLEVQLELPQEPAPTYALGKVVWVRQAENSARESAELEAGIALNAFDRGVVDRFTARWVEARD
ncbi:MAG: PilZ domain-containing protein [Candidatus Omnitrophica bacterium]|nr:PilZ domain-containing protein [Candidatus Omnitrophota bacterium]